MTALEIILLITSLLLPVLYLSPKMGKGQSLSETIKEVNQDLSNTAENVSTLIIKAKEVICDESVLKDHKSVHYDC